VTDRNAGRHATSRKNGPVTLKTIAAELGLSFSTVSKALNHDPLVNDQTAERVRAKAEELNYHPNTLARGLRSNKSKTIGFILNDLENPNYASIVKKISVEMSAHGFTVLLCDSQFDLEMEQRNIRTILSKRPDAIIISPVAGTSQNLLALRQQLDKVIFLDYLPDSPGANYVYVNHKHAGHISATRLLREGHTNIATFTAPATFPGSVQYLDGIRQAFTENGVAFEEDLVVHTIPTLENGHDEYLKHQDRFMNGRDEPVSAILSYCDMMAFGVYGAAAECGQIIPDDLSIIGFDDHPFASFSCPPLTTVHLPNERIAQHCSEILISQLVDHQPGLRTFFLEPYIVDRGSVRSRHNKPAGS